MRVGGAKTMLVAAMLAGAATMAQAQGASVKDGVDAWQRNDYTAAVAIWRPLAERGDADAAFDMAQAYKLGRGVPTDLAEAKKLYGMAAKGGHLQGAANYGLLLFQDGDRTSAMPWIKKASDAGDPRAQYVYGTALFNGDLAPKDWPRAYGLMTRAAAAGLPQATTNLSQMDQFLSPADRQKGLAMASALAAQPMPPLNRQMTVGADSAIPPQLPPAPTPVRAIDLASSRPPAPPVMVATPAPKPPKPPSAARAVSAPAPAPTAVAHSGGGWQVQLGAFSSEAAAASAWSALSGKASGLRGLSPSYERAGAIVRLRASGIADKAGAARACASAKSAGAACFPVAP